MTVVQSINILKPSLNPDIPCRKCHLRKHVVTEVAATSNASIYRYRAFADNLRKRVLFAVSNQVFIVELADIEMDEE